METDLNKNKPSLISMVNLFKKSWEVLIQNFWTFTKIMLVPIILFGTFFLTPILTTFIFSKLNPTIASLSIGIMVIAYIILVSWSALAFIWALKERINRPRLKECFKESFHFLFSFLWIQILHTIIVIGGFLFFFIPGVIFSISFMFCHFILITEGRKGINALIKSRDLMRGYWWEILKYLFALFLISFLIAFSVNLVIYGAILQSIIQIVVSFLIILFSNVYLFIFFENLKEMKKEEVFEEPSVRRKTKYVLMIILSLILISFTIIMSIKSSLSKSDPSVCLGCQKEVNLHNLKLKNN